ncbi:MAG: hypothetical protein LUE96_05015 [Lachnospiraceae bacterium]|nr:hypothetical protein [Lachnospiraceae bacterium]
MTEDYLQIMIESLEKKTDVLDRALELDKRQLAIAMAQPFDNDAYNRSMEEKGELIDELNRLDDGFTGTYELVRDSVRANPKAYAAQIEKMQTLIRMTIDKGVAIEAQEKRGKQAMESVVGSRRRELKEKKRSSVVARQYYKAMSKINTVDPQLMDKRK